MPDITMCSNDVCPIRGTCYRFMAKPSQYQSMAFFEPDKFDQCEYYWSMNIIDKPPTRANSVVETKQRKKL